MRDIEEKIAALGRDPTLDEVRAFAADVAKMHRTAVLTVEPDTDNPGRFKITSQDY